MRLQSIEIPVLDVERAFRFYADVLDFPPVVRMGDQMAVLFLGDVHGGMVSLVKSAVAPGHGPAIVLAAEGGMDAARARLEARGVTFSGTEHSPLGLTANFLDTEGNRLAIFDGSMSARFREQARAPLSELEARLGEIEGRAAATLAGIGDAQAHFRPAPQEWAVIGQVGHMIDSLDNCGVLAARLASGQQPPRDRLWQKEYPAGSFEGACAELHRAFADARVWLPSIPESAEGQANLPHGVFGPLNAREWAAFLLFHLDMHIGQIAAIKRHPAYPPD